MSQVHNLTDLDFKFAYDLTQSGGGINDGDILLLKDGAIAVMVGAWPTLVHGEAEGFHCVGDGYSFADIEGGLYLPVESLALALVAR